MFFYVIYTEYLNECQNNLENLTLIKHFSARIIQLCFFIAAHHLNIFLANKKFRFAI
jgi:hypothetical protein